MMRSQTGGIMQPSWTKRFWEMFVDEDYALIPLEKTIKIKWIKVASNRYWSKSGKWCGY